MKQIIEVIAGIGAPGLVKKKKSSVNITSRFKKCCVSDLVCSGNHEMTLAMTKALTIKIQVNSLNNIVL